MNLLNIRTWADARAFLHVALPAIAGVFVVAGYVTSDDATLWTALVLVAVDTGLSFVYSATAFRKALYLILPVVGALLVRYGLTTDNTWALWTGLVPVLFGSGVAAANTNTSTA